MGGGSSTLPVEPMPGVFKENLTFKLNGGASMQPAEPIREGYIFGGGSAQPHEFPYQVRLSSWYGQMCGGTILNTLFVLTAAHCLQNKSKKRWKVYAGDHSRSHIEDTEQIRDVIYVYTHENYNNNTFENDIALLVLSEPFDFNEYVRSISYVRWKNPKYYGLATVSGWGKTTEGFSHPDILQKVSLPLLSKSECQRKLKKFVTIEMLCAGSPSKDSCYGDSGGPLTCIENISRHKVVCGVVSFGFGCGRLEYPGVYMDVSNYHQWIDFTIARHFYCKHISEDFNPQTEDSLMSQNSTTTIYREVFCDVSEKMTDSNVGVTSAKEHEFPHHVLINHKGVKICSGTIISAFFILTSARCIYDTNEHTSLNYTVIAGGHNLSDKSDREQERDVEYFLLHENYNNITYENNIAILFLSQPLELNEFVDSIPYPMNTNKNYAGVAVSTGWSRLEKRGKFSDILEKLQVNFIPKSQCQRSYNGSGIVVDKMLCGGPGKNGCRGDGGGPLICTEKQTGRKILCGVVSFGRGCAKPGYSGLYTDLSLYWQWIDGLIKVNISQIKEKQ